MKEVAWYIGAAVAGVVVGDWLGRKIAASMPDTINVAGRTFVRKAS